VLGLNNEEHVFVGVRPPTENGDQCRLIPIADVVLAAVGAEAAVLLRREDHVRGVDVGAVLFSERPKAKIPPSLSSLAARF